MVAPLTTLQKKSLFKLLLDMMKADNHVALSEFVYLKEMRYEIGISQSEILEAEKFSVMESLANLMDMTIEDKKKVQSYLQKMLHADDIVNKNEVKLLKLVSKVLEIPTPKV